MTRQSAAAQTEAVRSVIGPVVTGAGYDLEGVSTRRAGKRTVLRILVDTDGGVTLDQVAELSRAISAALDDADTMGEQAYLLDVGSPGVDRPLTMVRHWRRNAGRLVRITGADDAVVIGRITEASGPADDQAPQTVVLDVDGTATELPGDQIRRAVVQVEFR